VSGDVHALTDDHLAILIPNLVCLSKVVQFFQVVKTSRQLEESMRQLEESRRQLEEALGYDPTASQKDDRQQTMRPSTGDPQTEPQSRNLWDSFRSGILKTFLVR
jgi:hypothetical protein